ncbi:MAG: DoxX family protein [Pseudomonadota bacterium]
MSTDAGFFPGTPQSRAALDGRPLIRSGFRRFLESALSDRVAHWFLRFPLAVLIWGYGIQKFPGAVTDPGSYGVPAVLFVLSAFGEVLGAVALLLGGMFETFRPTHRLLSLADDALTRLAAFAIASSVIGVMFFFHWGSISLGSPHVMYLGLALYLLLKGNNVSESRSRVTA